ncbi:MAG: type II secretion system F family protein [archaeon]
MNFQNKYLIGIGLGIIILIVDLAVFMGSTWFIPILIIAGIASFSQIISDFFIENQNQKEIESRFLDFVRNLAGAVKSGMPVSRAIIHISTIDYGALSPYAQKLGHQVEWAIPVHKALLFFGNSTRNDVIKRTIATVIEAEESGGNMEDVLESITSSLIEIKKIKDQRRAGIQSQVVQSYIIFIIFLGVMVLIQNMLVPYLVGGEKGGFFSKLSGGSQASSQTTQNAPQLVMDVEVKFDSFKSFSVTLIHWFSCLRGVFMMLSIIQGFFAGVTIGKMAEGDLISGLKHSIILMTISLLVMSIAKP